MDEVIWKARIYYQQNRQKGGVGQIWTNEKGNNFLVGSKGNTSIINKIPHKGQVIINRYRNQSRFRVPNESKTNEKCRRTEIEIAARPPVQCWGCGGPHYVKDYPNCKGTNQIS